MKNERLLELLENLKIIDSNGVTRLVEQIKNTFAPLVHKHTKADVGLDKVDNTPDSEKIVLASTTSTKSMEAQCLSEMVYIGDARFDGSRDITLKEMGVFNPIEVTKEEYQELKVSGQLDMNAYYNVIDDFDSVGLIDDTQPHNNQVYSSEKTEATYAKKSVIINVTLQQGTWLSTTEPNVYKYIIEHQSVTPTSVNEVFLKNTATSEETEAYQNANLQDGGQTNGSLTLKATGEKPKVNIPIQIIIRHDI